MASTPNDGAATVEPKSLLVAAQPTETLKVVSRGMTFQAVHGTRDARH